jgi:hypothetical protein
MFPGTRAVCFAKTFASFAVKTEKNRKGRKAQTQSPQRRTVSASNWSCNQSRYGGLPASFGKPPVLFGLARSFTSLKPPLNWNPFFIKHLFLSTSGTARSVFSQNTIFTGLRRGGSNSFFG